MSFGLKSNCAAIILGAVSFLPIQALAADCGGRPCINVGAFNIKLLGTSGPANTANEYREIGRLVATTMNLDVFVLEEINVRSTEWRGLRAELEARGYNFAFESAFGGERDQYLVIVYRGTTLQLTGPAPSDLNFPTRYAEPGTDCDYDNIRPPVTASFKAGNFDFQLVGVHLKSQLPVGRDSQCDDRIRTDQAKRIAEHVANSSEPDVIVLGDFNSAFVAPENNPFRDVGMRSAMEDRAPGSGDISFINSPRGLIDQIVFRGADRSYVPRSGFAYNLTQPDRRFYLASISDHVPIRASFYTDRDDD